MKKLLFLFVAGITATALKAQDLPQPSPSAKVEQTVGLTQVKIDYSRPSAKGRTIFGDVVPYDQLWRFGANACTKLSISTAIEIEGKSVPAGTYSLFALPRKDGNWTLSLNSDIEQSGTSDYLESKNVASINVKATAADFTETFTLEFSAVTINSAMIVMRWEKLTVAIPFSVKTFEIAEANIAAAIEKGEELEKVYYKAAAYYSRSLNDDKKAMEYIGMGLKVKETHTLHFLRAQILEKQGEVKSAKEEAELAYKLAIEADQQGWAEYIKSTMDSWK